MLNASRKFLCLWVILTSCGMTTLSFAAEQSAASQQAVETTVEAALPYLWEHGQAWIDKRGCVSCHQVPFMVWGLNAAAQQGFDVDASRLNSLIDWAMEIEHFDNPKNAADRTVAERAAANIDTMAQLILATRSATTSVESLDGEDSARNRFASFLIDEQRDDGSWKPCGQLPFQKRPKQETTEVTSMWVAYALGHVSAEPDRNVPITAFDQAQETAPVSTEWYAARLLLASFRGETEAVVTLQHQLRQFQNEDGGWGFLVNGESDAFGTGVTLYALKVTGTESVDSIAQGESFLIRTQNADGSWSVKSTKAKHQQQVTPTASYWGTAWAVISLVE